MSFIYITAPYFDEDKATRDRNYIKVSYYLTNLFIKKQFAYSPIIAHHHLINEFDMNRDATAWMAHNFAMLSSAKEFHVVTIDGWNDNVSVIAEINFWRACRQGSPIYYTDLDIIDSKRTKQLTRGTNRCAPVLKVG